MEIFWIASQEFELGFMKSEWRIQDARGYSQKDLHVLIEINIRRFFDRLTTKMTSDFRKFKTSDNIFKRENAGISKAGKWASFHFLFN